MKPNANPSIAVLGPDEFRARAELHRAAERRVVGRRGPHPVIDAAITAQEAARGAAEYDARAARRPLRPPSRTVRP